MLSAGLGHGRSAIAELRSGVRSLRQLGRRRKIGSCGLERKLSPSRPRRYHRRLRLLRMISRASRLGSARGRTPRFAAYEQFSEHTILCDGDVRIGNQRSVRVRFSTASPSGPISATLCACSFASPVSSCRSVSICASVPRHSSHRGGSYRSAVVGKRGLAAAPGYRNHLLQLLTAFKPPRFEVRHV